MSETASTTILLAPEAWPFLVAGLVMLAIGVIEALALLVGVSATGWLDALLHHGDMAGGGPDGWLGWLHVGKVPLLVLLVLFLGTFAAAGLALDMVARGLFGLRVQPVISVPVALVISLPVIRWLGALVARVIPKEESSAVSLGSLVGRVAVMGGGTARAGFPAEGKVVTEHGQTLYIMIEPDDPEVQFAPRDSVLLVRHVAATRFQAILNPRPDLL